MKSKNERDWFSSSSSSASNINAFISSSSSNSLLEILSPNSSMSNYWKSYGEAGF